MKKKILSIILLIALFFGVTPTGIFSAINDEPKAVNAVDHSGGYIYFDNSITNWNSSYKFMLFIGHNSYTSVYEMSKINGTNLYYYKMPSWGGATYCAVATSNNLWDSGNWGPSNRTNASNYTNIYNNYGFNNESTYLIKPTSSNNNCNINIEYYSNGYAFYNNLVKINANIQSSIDGSSATSSTNGGTIKITSYYLNGNGTSASSSESGVSASYGAVKTASATLTAIVSNGYKFLGWYEGNTLLSDKLEYKVENLTNTSYTYTAKFAIHITTIIFNKNSNDALGTIENLLVPYNKTITLPSTGFIRDGYFFAGWNSKADGTGDITYNDGNNYSYTNSIANDQTINLYAIWKIQVTITLMPEGGIVNPSSIISIDFKKM